MRVTIRPRIDPAPLEAFTASSAGWIVALLVWFRGMLDALPPEAQRNPALRAGVAFAKRQMRACLREAVRALRLLLIARAFAGLTLPAPGAGQTNRPSSTRHGFRRAARRSGELRRMIGDALAGVHEGTLRARAERLRDILDNLEPLILRVRARMLALFSRPIGAGLVLIAAFDALVRIAQAPTPACADTS